MDKLKDHPVNFIIGIVAAVIAICSGLIFIYSFFTGQTSLSSQQTLQITTTPTPLSISRSQTPVNQSVITTTNNIKPRASYAVGFNINRTRASHEEIVSYEVIVSNNGDTKLTNVLVYRGTLPVYTTYVSGSASADKRDGTNKKWVNVPDDWYLDLGGGNFGDLNPGGALVIRWSMLVDKDAPVGQRVNTVIGVKTTELQEPQGYNQSFIISGSRSQSSLHVTTSFDMPTVVPGEITACTINILNDGDIVQDDILVFDMLPDTLIYKPGSSKLSLRTLLPIDDSWIGRLGVNQGGGINLGSIYPGEQATASFQVTLSNNVRDKQVIENWGQVRSNQISNYIQSKAVFTVKAP